jgi:hypothetical protein
MWKDDAGNKHSLAMSARKGKESKRLNGFISDITLDGEAVAVPTTVDSSINTDGMAFTLSSQTTWGISDMDVFTLSIGDFNAEISLRVAHPLLQTSAEAFAHFNVKVDSFKPTRDVHGVLGQTFRADAQHLVKMLEYKLLASLLRGPVVADGESGAGYLEGSMQDYQTSGPASADCKYSSAWLQ